MSDDGGEDPRAKALERLTETLARLEVLYKTTENPIYVWEAISAQNFLWKYPQRFGSEHFNLLTPQWVGDYLMRSASGMTVLNSGHIATDRKNGSQELARINSNAPRFSIDPVDRKKLNDKVSAVLGLAVGGGNAFKKYQSTRRDLAISRRVAELRDSGMTRQQSINRYIAESKEIDFSVLEKRLARGDKLLKLINTARRRSHSAE